MVADQVQAGQRVAQGDDQDEEDADRHDEPALDLVVVGQGPDVGRFGVGAGDLGRHVDALIFAEKVVQPAAQGQDLVHRRVGEHAIGLGQVDAGAVAVGRDVGGEAAFQSSGWSCTVWSLISRRSSARRPTGSFEDRGDLAMGAGGSFGDLGGTVGRAGQLAQQDLLRFLGLALASARVTRASQASVRSLRRAASTAPANASEKLAASGGSSLGPLEHGRGLPAGPMPESLVECWRERPRIAGLGHARVAGLARADQ